MSTEPLDKPLMDALDTVRQMVEQDFDSPDDGEDCPNCGGEGYVYDCFDGFCINAEDGCDDCRQRCDWCNRRKLTQPA